MPLTESMHPVVQRVLKNVHEPAVHSALAQLASDFRQSHSAVYKQLYNLDTDKDGLLSVGDVKWALRVHPTPNLCTHGRQSAQHARATTHTGVTPRHVIASH